MHILKEQKCPYCNVSLVTIPKRKTKCKSCNNYYYVTTRISDEAKVIATEKERDENARCPLSLLHLISDNEFQEAKNIVLSKGGVLNINDIIWGLLNKKVLAEMKEGKDVFHLLQESAKCKLMDYRQAGLKKVEVLTANQASCDACNKQNRKILTIDEALETMPIPVKECSTEVFVDGKGFCRCLYVACVD